MLSKILILSSGLLLSCGEVKQLTDPDYQPYEAPGAEQKQQTASNEDSTDTNTDKTQSGSCPDSADSFFSTNVESKLLNGCGSCHGEAHKYPMTATNIQTVRTDLLSRYASASDLVGFLTSSHPGGNQSALLPDAEGWFTAEAACKS